jgi:hypothetical protein
MICTRTYADGLWGFVAEGMETLATAMEARHFTLVVYLFKFIPSATQLIVRLDDRFSANFALI